MPRRQQRYRRRALGLPRRTARPITYEDRRLHRYRLMQVHSQLMGNKYKRIMSVTPLGSYRFRRAMSKYYRWNPVM